MRSLLLSSSVLCLLFAGPAATAAPLADAKADAVKETGPLGLVIEYRCNVANRVAFRQEVERSITNFEQLKNDGAVARYRLLFSRYVDSNVWDAIALVEFASYGGVRRWKKLEQTNPAGLNKGALALTSGIATYPVDLVRSGGGGEPADPKTDANTVYMVIPYSLTVTPAAYLQYSSDYVIPQLEGWMREGVLNRYQFQMQRYTAARPWDALLVLEYRDDDSFGRREQVVAKVRQELAKNPVWKAISDNKQSVRTERMAVIADRLVNGSPTGK